VGGLCTFLGHAAMHQAVIVRPRPLGFPVNGVRQPKLRWLLLVLIGQAKIGSNVIDDVLGR